MTLRFANFSLFVFELYPLVRRPSRYYNGSVMDMKERTRIRTHKRDNKEEKSDITKSKS